ncbi:MAG: hypothetical protein QN174_07835 [Armatimonadota bacterium]|nr:hypothetical protein [Armatimonadota bacterium]
MPYSDNFNRADNGDLGAPWVEREYFDQPTDPHPLSIVSQRLRLRGGFDDGFGGGMTTKGFAFWDQALAHDQYAQAVWYADVGGASTGVAVRVDPASTLASCTMYAAVYRPAIGVVRLERYLAQPFSDFVFNPPTELGFWSGTLSPGDVLRIEAVGTGIVVRRNGVAIISATDAAIASGRAGVLSENAVAFSDPSNDVYDDWDDWEADAAAAPEPPSAGDVEGRLAAEAYLAGRSVIARALRAEGLLRAVVQVRAALRAEAALAGEAEHRRPAASPVRLQTVDSDVEWRS